MYWKLRFCKFGECLSLCLKLPGRKGIGQTVDSRWVLEIDHFAQLSSELTPNIINLRHKISK